MNRLGRSLALLTLSASTWLTPAAFAQTTPGSTPAPGSGTGSSGASTPAPPAAGSSSTAPPPIAPLVTGMAPKLAGDISAAAALNKTQVDTVDEFVRYWARQLNAGSDDQVADARNALIDPPNRAGLSDAFRNVYSNSLNPQLVTAFASDRVLVKVNVLIVAASIADARTLRLLTAGMSDNNIAVRYWAGKAAIVVASRPNLPRNDKINLMNLLVGQMGNEPSGLAIKPQLVALGELNIAEANEQLLTGINQRVNQHLRTSDTNLSPEQEALLKLYQKTVAARGTPAANPAAAAAADALVRQIGTVAYRYLVVSSAVLDLKRVTDPARVADAEGMARLCDQILRWVRETLAPQAASPPPIDGELSARNWALIRLRNDDWRKLLTTAPINLATTDLEVQVGAGPAN
jgi:hypothetical protein